MLLVFGLVGQSSTDIAGCFLGQVDIEWSVCSGRHLLCVRSHAFRKILIVVLLVVLFVISRALEKLLLRLRLRIIIFFAEFSFY